MSNQINYPLSLPKRLRKKTVSSKISRDIFFVDCLNDLYSCAILGDTYQLLRSSVLLRVLLYEDGGWIKKMAEEYKFELSFNANNFELEGKHESIPRSGKKYFDSFSEFKSKTASYHFVNLLQEPKKEYSLEDFKNRICLIIRGSKDYCFSIQGIICLLAHKHGAAHIDEGFEDTELDSFHFNEFNPFSINQGSFFTKKIKEIILILCKSVYPLATMVKKKLVQHDNSIMQHTTTSFALRMSNDEYEKWKKTNENMSK